MSCEEGEGGGVNLSWNKILGWGEERKKGKRGEMSFLPLNSTGGREQGCPNFWLPRFPTPFWLASDSLHFLIAK